MSKIKELIETVAEKTDEYRIIGLTLEDSLIKALDYHGICKPSSPKLHEELAIWGEAIAPYIAD